MFSALESCKQAPHPHHQHKVQVNANLTIEHEEAIYYTILHAHKEATYDTILHAENVLPQYQRQRSCLLNSHISQEICKQNVVY